MIRAIAWFASNHVAANLLMWFLIVAGLVTALGLHREEFPPITPGQITIQIDYPGGAPAEVEESICVRVEDHLDGTNGVKHLHILQTTAGCIFEGFFDA